MNHSHCLDKVLVDNVTPNSKWISSLYYDIYTSWISWIYCDKALYVFCYFCKMIINKTIVIGISLSNRSCPYEFNASIDFWLKITSQVDVITPSTVLTSKNAKLLPSPNLCHSLMLFRVTRSHSEWGSVTHFSEPPVHYIDVIMTTMASHITSLAVVYSIVYSGVDQRKHQSSASLAFVRGIHRDRWIPRTKGQLGGKCFHLMTSSWLVEPSRLCRNWRSCRKWIRHDPP